MSESMGSLVDKLITVDIKLWFMQDRVHKAAEGKVGLEADTVQRLSTLNLQRNQLMFEIDTFLDRSIKEGRAEVDPHIKLT